MSNLDQALPDQEIDLLGKVRKVTFSLGAFARAEKITGKSCYNGMLSNLSAEIVIAVTWGALSKPEREEFTFDDVGDSLTLADTARLMAVITKGLQSAAPPEVADSAAKNVPAES